MFDMLKNLGGLADVMRRAGEMKSRMEQLQRELAHKTVEADAGAGAVTATMNGRLELVSLRIDREKLDLTDVELIEDLVVAAVNAAQHKAADLSRQEMSRLAGELGLPPGLLGP